MRWAEEYIIPALETAVAELGAEGEPAGRGGARKRSRRRRPECADEEGAAVFGCSFFDWFLFGCSYLCRGGICICTRESARPLPEKGTCAAERKMPRNSGQ